MVRINEHTSYTRVPTDIIRDKNIPPAAKGVYMTLCWCPENWRYSVAGLAKFLGVSKGAVTRATGLLEQHGYIKREKMTRGRDGRFAGIEYRVLASPCIDNEDTKVLSNVTNMDKTTLDDNYPYCLTTSLTAFEKHFHRKLMPTEVAVWETWQKEKTDPRIIQRAIEDNEFRKDKLDLHYVEKTLSNWHEAGLTTVKMIDNHILDAKCTNIRSKIKEKMYDAQDEEIDAQMLRTTAGVTQKYRDEIMHLYRTRNRDFINIVKDCPITEVYKYLPDEVLRMMIRVFEEINETEKKEAAIEAMEVKV